MLDYKTYLENIINRRDYELSALEERIDRLWLDGKLTEADRDALMALAAENARDELQVDVLQKLTDHEKRLQALEATEEPQYVVWTQNYQTAKGETVLRDIDGDGNYEMCRYDGGRASTGLDVGRIDGWHLVDSQGNVLGTISKANGAWTVTPVQEAAQGAEDGEGDPESTSGENGPDAAPGDSEGD